MKAIKDRCAEMMREADEALKDAKARGSQWGIALYTGRRNVLSEVITLIEIEEKKFRAALDREGINYSKFQSEVMK